MIQSLVYFGTCISLLLVLVVKIPPRPDPPRIIVGGDHKFPPYEYLENGQPTRFNIDLIRAVAEDKSWDS